MVVLHRKNKINLIVTDPWKAASPPVRQPLNDPWSPATETSPVHSVTTPLSDLDEFDQIVNRDKTNGLNNNPTGTCCNQM